MSESAAVLRNESTKTTAGTSVLSDAAWAVGVAADQPSRGFGAMLWRLFNDHRQVLDVITVAVGTSFVAAPRAADYAPEAGIRLIATYTETPARGSVALSVPIRPLVDSETHFDDLRTLTATLNKGSFPSFSEASLKLARQALHSLDSREEENVDEWARRIVGDFGTITG